MADENNAKTFDFAEALFGPATISSSPMGKKTPSKSKNKSAKSSTSSAKKHQISDDEMSPSPVPEKKEKLADNTPAREENLSTSGNTMSDTEQEPHGSHSQMRGKDTEKSVKQLTDTVTLMMQQQMEMQKMFMMQMYGQGRSRNSPDSSDDEHDDEDSEDDNNGQSRHTANREFGDRIDSLLRDDKEDPLSQLEAEFKTQEKVGPEVNTKLASIVQDIVKTKMDEDVAKAKLDKYPVPANCTELAVPAVNQELWSKLSTTTRSRDIRLQRIHTRITKAMVAMVTLADRMLASKTQKQDLDATEGVRLALDAVSLAANAGLELSQHRRQMIKPDLNKQYAQLCSTQVPVTKHLFGDDLSKTLKDINETNKVGAKVSTFKTSRFLGRTSGKYNQSFARSKGKNSWGKQRSKYGGYNNNNNYSSNSQNNYKKKRNNEGQ